MNNLLFLKKIFLGKPLLCRVGLHWPLQRKFKAFKHKVNHKPVYFCQCNCRKYWLAEGRYKFFKLEQKHPEIWIERLPEDSPLPRYKEDNGQ